MQVWVGSAIGFEDFVGFGMKKVQTWYSIYFVQVSKTLIDLDCILFIFRVEKPLKEVKVCCIVCWGHSRSSCIQEEPHITSLTQPQIPFQSEGRSKRDKIIFPRPLVRFVSSEEKSEILIQSKIATTQVLRYMFALHPSDH